MENTSFDEQELIEKIRSLPPDKAVEVEDFVDFLHRREDSGRLADVTAKLSETSLQRVWDNPDDGVYDHL